MLIYLNRTGFNGLFRLNARGAFNVPAGRYAPAAIVDREQARRRSPARCRGRGVQLRVGIVRTGHGTSRRPAIFSTSIRRTRR